LPKSSSLCFGVQTNNYKTNKGFYIHPFYADDVDAHFISHNLDAEDFLKMDCENVTCEVVRKLQPSISETDYLIQAEQCVKDLRAGVLSKIVLSRTISGEYNGSWMDVFKSLLNIYPDAMVFLFHSHKTGAWMGATPELFLSKNADVLYTMALAGTRLAGTQSDWGEKEIVEQRFVADYIGNCFHEVGVKYDISNTYTRNAGNVEHLCNDFQSGNATDEQISALRDKLHPTPAIAGTPSKDAVEYIRNIEKHSRRYYCGYVGPVSETGDFDFYVNLRSLEFLDNKYCLYVGGGLTAASVTLNEWQETAEKAKTLQRFLL
jgi:isochorismate synthase